MTQFFVSDQFCYLIPEAFEKWTTSSGISGRHPPESVDGLLRIWRSICAGLCNLGQKLLIRVDSTAQGYVYQPEVRILNKFDTFTEVRVAPLGLLLSHKLYTAINRKRPKGRDFFDITFLLGRTKPDYGFLVQKMGINSPEDLRQAILERIVAYDFEALARDVEPFLIDQAQVKRVKLFRMYWENAEIS